MVKQNQLFNIVVNSEEDEEIPMEGQPLAARLRPKSIEQIIGQDHITNQKSSVIKNLINHKNQNSVIIYGPPGSGKTTLAQVISNSISATFHSLSALDLTVKDLREYIDNAKNSLVGKQLRTVIFIDEIHRFTKTQQDALLNAVENGVITFIGATTENPSFTVIAPLLSRSLVLKLNPLTDDSIETILKNALKDKNGLNNKIKIDNEAIHKISRISAGDARKALTILESCFFIENEQGSITEDSISKVITEALVRYDRDGDNHYDVISAFIKSIRGSDPDAAIHYLARMVHVGEDPRFIARRLVIAASEDIGMADPQALLIANAASDAVAKIGWPESQIILAQATIYLATAPKSNSVVKAINNAISEIKSGNIYEIPPHLRDSHYFGAKDLGNGVNYKYPHDYPNSLVKQQYLPEELKQKTYYEPSSHGNEKSIKERIQKIREFLR